MQSVPRHFFPSALKPNSLQSQIYEPTVLMHSVKYGHTSFGLAHSSISEMIHMLRINDGCTGGFKFLLFPKLVLLQSDRVDLDGKGSISTPSFLCSLSFSFAMIRNITLKNASKVSRSDDKSQRPMFSTFALVSISDRALLTLTDE